LCNNLKPNQWKQENFNSRYNMWVQYMENNMLKCLSRHKTQCPSNHMVSCVRQDVVKKLDSWKYTFPCKVVLCIVFYATCIFKGILKIWLLCMHDGHFGYIKNWPKHKNMYYVVVYNIKWRLGLKVSKDKNYAII
jgi:hypothetical protein